VWVEFLQFPCWDRNNLDEEKLQHSYEKIVKNVTDLKTHHKNIPPAAH
jgi:hypothetical protein